MLGTDLLSGPGQPWRPGHAVSDGTLRWRCPTPSSRAERS